MFRSANHKSVSKNPMIFALRFLSLPVTFLGGVSSFGLGIRMLLHPMDTASYSLFWPSWLVAFLAGLAFCLLFLRGYLLLRFWLRLEPRRFAAASAFPQRQMMDQWVMPIAFPLKLTMRFYTHLVFLWILPLFVMLAPAPITEIVNITREGKGLISQHSIVLLVLGSVMVSFVPIAILTIVLFSVRWTINVTENGIEQSGHMIFWQEARLFACYRVPGLLWRQKGMLQYELSSANQMITWQGALDPQSLFMMWKPFLPPEIYHQRIQELRELIVVRTGLPLCDLSQPVESDQENVKH